MWLLNTQTLQLSSFQDEQRPAYAILSHTWGPDEITFQDVVNDKLTEKMLPKVRRTCEQARVDDLQWVWIDTFCINKESSAELSEAINSMFAWYANATVCYVYLADVRNLYDGEEQSAFDEFSSSRWFTRGWTLQELIAPTHVVFYDAAWTLVSDRVSAAQQISRITGIDLALLQGRRDLSSYSVAQRMSWASNRMTTRKEDLSYCLFGLFQVNMPLLYGEGDRAFIRLQTEILRTTSDLSILAWRGTSSDVAWSPLASHPRLFSSSRDTVSYDAFTGTLGLTSETTMSNLGFRCSALVMVLAETENKPGGLVMLLECRDGRDITTVTGLKLSTINRRSTTSLKKEIHERALKRSVIDCVVGWPYDVGQERLINIDILAAEAEAVASEILIRRGAATDVARSMAAKEDQRGWTYLWIRHEDAVMSRTWETKNVWPKQHWNHVSRTFDLAAARADQVEKEERLPAASRTLVFGLPIFGAIALEDRAGQCVTVFFCQRSPSLDDGLLFELVHGYDVEIFLKPDQRLLERNATPAHSLTLQDGFIFEAKLLVKRIAGHVVAHVAVTITQAPKSVDTEQSTGAHSKSRNPLSDFVRRQRDPKINGS